ncbi:vicilin-like seed storage protein At2g18540 [Pollicipes pollicipes]|uniref:vicilin-like seed storage protein At2g18540 n=1 Tax=Pollicipes pollicipes TaxID=41117 RepID=UPI0018858D80|nr:vicilin-like seed storage protein At2g18540 [Pollicipes pollicipes]
MDYAGLLSQKRAEESRFRSGWDPIGSPSGLSRSRVGSQYLGGSSLMSAESALQRLDSYSGGSTSFGGGLDSYGAGSTGYGVGSSSFGGGLVTGGGGMSTSGPSMPGNAGDPGAARRQMQENYRRDLMKQAEEDRARKLADRQREQQHPLAKETGPVSTIYRPSFLDAQPSNGRRKSVVNAYGDDLAQQIEDRRQRQERDRNNLLMYNQQQNEQTGLRFGDNGGNARGRRPHVSETWDREAGTVQAELQQQIADKKQREMERKRREAEEDAQLNARLEEQQRKVREDLAREQEAREQKERNRLERQRLIEEQQRRSQEEAENMRRAARDLRAGQTAATTTNEWDSWGSDRPAGTQNPEPPLEDLWPKEEVYKPPSPPPPPPVESKPNTPPPAIHPSHDTSDLAIGFELERSQREEVRLDSPELDDLAKRNRERQRRLEERRRGQ